MVSLGTADARLLPSAPRSDSRGKPERKAVDPDRLASIGWSDQPHATRWFIDFSVTPALARHRCPGRVRYCSMRRRDQGAARGTLFHPDRRVAADICRVCGHRTIPRARQAVNALLLVLVGMLVAYIALDIAHGGHLDGSLYQAVRETWRQIP
jgi:hypothetical protein